MPPLIGKIESRGTASLKRNVDLENAVVNVVPTKGVGSGGVQCPCGSRVLMKTSKRGIPLRFGAIATLDGIQTNSGIIDDDGSLYMSGFCPLRKR